MPKYIVTTRNTDLRVRADHHTYSPIIGSLPKGKDVEVVEVFDARPVGQWMKLGPSERFAGGWAYAGDHGEFLKLAPGAPPRPDGILLFFGGAGRAFPPGADMTPTDEHGPRTSQMAYEHFVAVGQFAKSRAFNSAVDDGTINPAVQAGLGFLAQPSCREGRLVIYGFSAGGFNAVRLCELIGNSGRQVDLLITVDPCIQDIDPNEAAVIRTPRPPVVEHFNWYQRGPGDHYRGRRITSPSTTNNFVVPPPPTPPINRSRHDQMPDFTKVWVQTEIARILWGREVGSGSLHAYP